MLGVTNLKQWVGDAGEARESPGGLLGCRSLGYYCPHLPSFPLDYSQWSLVCGWVGGLSNSSGVLHMTPTKLKGAVA